MGTATMVEPNCPKCGAAPGEPCRARAGRKRRPRPMKGWHRERAEAAGFSPTQHINDSEERAADRS
jgi:hypothetical protein